MGAWLILLTALARPERIAGLLGLACAADFTRYLLWDRLDERLRERLQREKVITLPSAYGAPYTIALKLIEEAEQHRLLERTELPITVPVRLIHGMDDADAPWPLLPVKGGDVAGITGSKLGDSMKVPSLEQVMAAALPEDENSDEDVANVDEIGNGGGGAIIHGGIT